MKSMLDFQDRVCTMALFCLVQVKYILPRWQILIIRFFNNGRTYYAVLF